MLYLRSDSIIYFFTRSWLPAVRTIKGRSWQEERKAYSKRHM